MTARQMQLWETLRHNTKNLKKYSKRWTEEIEYKMTKRWLRRGQSKRVTTNGDEKPFNEKVMRYNIAAASPYQWS